MTSLAVGDGRTSERHMALSGIGLVLMAFALFSTMDTMAKWLTGGYPLAQIVLTNALFSQTTMLLILPLFGGRRALRTRRPGLHLLRGAITVCGAFGVFFAFNRMPMADVYAIIFAAPFMITALSVPMLGESVGWRRWAAIVAGFIGVLVMLRPGGGIIDFGALGALAAALGHAVSMLIVRRMGGEDPGVTFAFYSNISALSISGTVLLASGGFVPPAPSDLLLFAGCGITGGLGLVCITTGFSRAPAAVLAPFQYSQMLWGVTYGYLVFGDRPDAWLAVGGGIVIGSGFYLLHREARAKRDEVASAAAALVASESG